MLDDMRAVICRVWHILAQSVAERMLCGELDVWSTKHAVTDMVHILNLLSIHTDTASDTP